MNYNEALNYIHSLLRFGSRPGLERITQLLHCLGDPQDGIKFIHIAGTNGKGSVSAMTANILKSAGYRTGLYISPYITCFRERIQINGEYISEQDLAKLTDEVRSVGIEVTEFEFITAVAFLYYKRNNCGVVVLETGLGGRLDATNVIKAPLASVITGIGLDHTGVLGDTLEQIAGEKCGIIKPGSPVFTTYNQPSKALDVITSYPNVTVTKQECIEIKESGISGSRFIYKGEEYSVSLIGKHQVENAVLAIETVNGCGLKPSLSDIKKGISTVSFPARLELLCKEPLVMLDGAHNPHGAAALATEMKKHSNITLITGMMADKDCEQVLSLVAPLCKKIITVTVKENPRSISAAKLAKAASRYCDDVRPVDTYSDALNATVGDSTVFISGSLYLAGAIRESAIKFYNSTL